MRRGIGAVERRDERLEGLVQLTKALRRPSASRRARSTRLGGRSGRCADCRARPGAIGDSASGVETQSGAAKENRSARRGNQCATAATRPCNRAYSARPVRKALRSPSRCDAQQAALSSPSRGRLEAARAANLGARADVATRRDAEALDVHVTSRDDAGAGRAETRDGRCRQPRQCCGEDGYRQSVGTSRQIRAPSTACSRGR